MKYLVKYEIFVLYWKWSVIGWVISLQKPWLILNLKKEKIIWDFLHLIPPVKPWKQCATTMRKSSPWRPTPTTPSVASQGPLSRATPHVRCLWCRQILQCLQRLRHLWCRHPHDTFGSFSGLRFTCNASRSMPSIPLPPSMLFTLKTPSAASRGPLLTCNASNCKRADVRRKKAPQALHGVKTRIDERRNEKIIHLLIHYSLWNYFI